MTARRLADSAARPFVQKRFVINLSTSADFADQAAAASLARKNTGVLREEHSWSDKIK
jgi:hypothetical protein